MCNVPKKSIIVYLSSLLPLPIPSLQIITECQTGFPVLYSNFSPCIHFTSDAAFSIRPTLSLHHCVPKSIFYIWT